MKMNTTSGMAACVAAAMLVLPLSACGSSDEGKSGGLSTAAEAAPADTAVESTVSKEADKGDEKDKKKDDAKKDEKKATATTSKKKESKEEGGNQG